MTLEVAAAAIAFPLFQGKDKAAAVIYRLTAG